MKMTKKISRDYRQWGLILGITATLIFSFAAKSSAAWGKNKAQAKPKAEPLAAVIPQEKKMEVMKETAIKLNNTVWEIQLTQISTAKEKETFKDTLRFADYKFISDRLSPDGFGASNFTLAMPHENVVVWETMQDSGKNGLALWKGQLVEGDEVMRGVLSLHLNDKANTVKDYTFVSVKKEIIALAEDKEAAAAAPAEARIDK
jgi:hypothetical protein